MYGHWSTHLHILHSPAACYHAAVVRFRPLAAVVLNSASASRARSRGGGEEREGLTQACVVLHTGADGGKKCGKTRCRFTFAPQKVEDVAHKQGGRKRSVFIHRKQKIYRLVPGQCSYQKSVGVDANSIAQKRRLYLIIVTTHSSKA